MKRLIILLLVLFTVAAKGQDIEPPKPASDNAFLLFFDAGYQVPGGDMADRFLNNFVIGAGGFYKYRNWLFGFEGNFIIRDTTREGREILQHLTSSNGFINGEDGLPADQVLIQERGYSLMLKAGRILPILDFNRNSGITLIAGTGFLQHKIQIIDKEDAVPQLQGEYVKGYDRLTNGFAVSEFIGYTYMDSRNFLSFFAGFEFIQAWTKNRRTWNYDTNEKDSRLRNDFLYGFKAGLIIPIQKKTPAEYYYY